MRSSALEDRPRRARAAGEVRWRRPAGWPSGHPHRGKDAARSQSRTCAGWPAASMIACTPCRVARALRASSAARSRSAWSSSPSSPVCTRRTTNGPDRRRAAPPRRPRTPSVSREPQRAAGSGRRTTGSRARAPSAATRGRTAGRSSPAADARRRRRRSSGSRTRPSQACSSNVKRLSTCPGWRMKISSSASSLALRSSCSLATPSAVARRVEPQVADLEHRRALDRPAARERAQPRQQLVERERLGEIVVGAGVEPVDAVGHLRPRGEHQHGRPDAVRAQAAADVEPVEVGEHRVEHDRVVLRRRPRAPARRRPSSRHVDREARRASARAAAPRPSSARLRPPRPASGEPTP